MLSPEESKLLEIKAKQLGFLNKSEYIRFALFIKSDFMEKLNKIYEKVCVEQCWKK